MLCEPSLQDLYTVLKLRDLVAQSVHIGLHSKRGLRPVLRRKGKRPRGVVRLRQRFHDVSSRHIIGSDRWTFYSGDMRLGPEENARGEGHRAPWPASATGCYPVIAHPVRLSARPSATV